MVNLAYFICGQAKLVPLAIGKPGVAKTSMLMVLARLLGMKLYILTGSIREPADIGGYPTLVEVMWDGKTIQYMKIVPPEYVVKALSEPTILFIDELTCCHPGTQSAMLAIAAERRVGDTYLPDSTLIFGACNPPGTAANGFPLEATMANRLVHLQWEFPRESWLEGMRDGLNYPSFSEDNFPILPDDWHDEIRNIGLIVAEFHEREPGYLQPEEDEDGNLRLSNQERSGAYPTPRTWDMAVRGMAAVRSVERQIEKLKGNTKGVEEQVLRGCVGYAAAEAFCEYADNLDLPDPNEVINNVIKVKALEDVNDDAVLDLRYASVVPDPKRADKVSAFVRSVISAVIVDATKERWLAAEEIARQSMKKHKEIVVCSIGRLYDKELRKQCQAYISDDMTDTVGDTLGPATILAQKEQGTLDV